MHQAAWHLWQRAKTFEGTILREFIFPSVAGIATTHVHFAGSDLADAYSWALGHRLRERMDTEATTPAVSRFKIFLWDAATTGVPLPSPPDALRQLGPHGAIPNLPDHQRAIFQGNSGVLTLFDSQAAHGFVIVSDASQLPNFDLAAPMRFLMSWIGAQTAFTLTHAAAVATSEGAALLIGRGGSGKSTTSLACALDGFQFLGDDYVGIENTTEGPIAHCLYRSAKVAAPSFHLLPQLEKLVRRQPSGADDAKHLLLAADFAVGGVPLSAPVRALFLPKIVKSPISRVTAAPKAAALAALAPSTIFQLSGDGPQLLTRLAGLVQQVPAFHLCLGRDGTAPGLIRQVLARGLS